VNIMIQANAFKVNGNELANLDKAVIIKTATLNVGEVLLPDLSINENEIQKNKLTKTTVDEYDELI